MRGGLDRRRRDDLLDRFDLDPRKKARTTLLVLIQSAQSQSLYDTPQALEKLRSTIGGNTAVITMSGPTALLDSIGARSSSRSSASRPSSSPS